MVEVGVMGKRKTGPEKKHCYRFRGHLEEEPLVRKGDW